MLALVPAAKMKALETDLSLLYLGMAKMEETVEEWTRSCSTYKRGRSHRHNSSHSRGRSGSRMDAQGASCNDGLWQL